MKITQKDWNKYRDLMGKISEKAANEFKELCFQNGVLKDLERSKIIEYANALIMKYGQASGALSCEMYEEIAKLQGIDIDPAEMAELPEYGEVAKAVNGAWKQGAGNMPGVVQRMVKQVGADTTLKNALRDGAQFAWIPSGDTCAFCLTLASRGWQKVSKNTLKKGHAEHIHAHCDCQYAVRFDEKSTVEGYDPDKYLEMYENAEGKTPEEKINSLRRTLQVNKKTANMSKEEYARATKLWKQVKEIKIPQSEREHVYEELDNNLSVEEKESAIVRRSIGNYVYTAVNKGHNQYKIYQKEAIEPIDEILDEVLDFDWRKYL